MLPIYVHDINQVKAEDDSPIPANTPETGTANHTRVIGCGNRVLEIIEKHKRDIQSRMANRADTFRGILEKEIEGRNTRKGRRSISQSHPLTEEANLPSTSGASAKNAIQYLPPSFPAANEKNLMPQSPSSAKKVRHSAEAKIINLEEGRHQPQHHHIPSAMQNKLPLISSEEYLEPPPPGKKQGQAHTNSEKHHLSNVEPNFSKVVRKGSLRTGNKDTFSGTNKRVTILPLPPPEGPSDKSHVQDDCMYEAIEGSDDGHSWNGDDNANNRSAMVYNASHPPQFPISQEEIRKSLKQTEKVSRDGKPDLSYNNAISPYRRKSEVGDVANESSSTTSDEELKNESARARTVKRRSSSPVTASQSTKSPAVEAESSSAWSNVFSHIWEHTWAFLLLIAVILVILGLCVVTMDKSIEWNWNWNIFGKEQKETEIVKPKSYKYKREWPVM